MKKQDETKIYEFHLRDYLGENAAIWFEGFEVKHTANGETVLHGTIIDQAALHGILTRIRDLGLTLMSINQINKDS
ncbi:MAG: hypothetical protein FP831_10875 [Anaerolineae bacterium]|nr:hypothetical protein [Anaerolineae bacterium]